MLQYVDATNKKNALLIKPVLISCNLDIVCSFAEQGNDWKVNEAPKQR